jgi:hypothetical protein
VAWAAPIAIVEAKISLKIVRWAINIAVLQLYGGAANQSRLEGNKSTQNRKKQKRAFLLVRRKPPVLPSTLLKIVRRVRKGGNLCPDPD